MKTLTAPTSAATTAPGGARVLLLEDDAVAAKSIRRLLVGRSYDVDVATDPEQAIRLFRDTPYEVVISDIDFPADGGTRFLEEVHRSAPGLPVIMITEEPTLESAVEAVNRGAFQYLAKPFRASVLADVVTRAAEHGRIRRLQSQAAVTGGEGDRTEADEAFTRALDTTWFAYQPIADRNWNIYGYEAFLRCDEESLKDPRAFLAAGDQLGRQRELLARIRASVTQPVMARRDATLFLNLHPSHFELEDPDDPSDHFAANRERMVLEITQRHPLASDEDMTAMMSGFRKLGYGVAVGDVAATYGSGEGIATNGPNFIKLNGSLVRNVSKHWQRKRIIEGVCEVCKDLDVLVVAEQVEDSDEFEVLKGLGCDLFQGYFVGRPEPLAPPTRG